MNRRQLVAGLAAVPIAIAVPAGAVAGAGAAAGTPEALAEMRSSLATDLTDALRGATCRDLSSLDPFGQPIDWGYRVREAARHLAEFDDGRGVYRDFALYGQTPAPDGP